MFLAPLLLAAVPGRAGASLPEHAELNAFVQARVAETIGEGQKAARDYQIALALAPGNKIVAAAALDQALTAGDRALAVRAARILDRPDTATPDVQLVLLTEALRNKAWPAAEARVVALSRDSTFSFMAPLLAAWVALGSRNDDPLQLLDKAASDPLGGAYAASHRSLLLFAMGREREGLAALRGRIDEQDSRSVRLLISAAAQLARERKRREALALLQGDAPALVAARHALQRRGKIKGDVVTPAQGIAEFFLRLALDLERQEVTSLALSFARLSSFLDPEHAETWLVISGLAAKEGRNPDALAALRMIPAEDWTGGIVGDQRARLLARTGNAGAAVDQAQKAAHAKDASTRDWIRLGDLYAELGRNREAAEAFGHALQVKGEDRSLRPDWWLWLRRGGALEQAGLWTDAKAALETAYRLAPAEPLVLNYLGYAQLERRENIPQAEKLIREASRLSPDNAQITDSLGWARFLQGDTREAITLLERAVRGEPADSAINEHLGDVYYSVGRRFEARHAWGAALVAAEERDAARLRAKIDRGLTPDLASP